MSQLSLVCPADPYLSAMDTVNAELAHKPEAAARVVGLLIDAAALCNRLDYLEAELRTERHLKNVLAERLLALTAPEPLPSRPERRARAAVVIPFASVKEDFEQKFPMQSAMHDKSDACRQDPMETSVLQLS